MKLWQIVAVVALGVLYGELQPGRLTDTFAHATLYVLLPVLLFEGAWNLHFRAMRRQWRAIVTLAVPGVMLSAAVVAAALWAARVPFAIALLTGAILSATDPIAVIAVFRRLRVPLALRTIVECESLFNDAVAVVLYRAVLPFAVTEAVSGGAIAQVTLISLAGSLGGIALGIGAAFAVAQAMRGTSSRARQLTASVVAAYGAYFAAELLHGSGIFAVIACGIAMRYFERRWISLTIVEGVNRFWDRAALAGNVVIFFLVGAALNISSVSEYPVFVLVTLAGVAAARLAVSALLLPGGFPREWHGVVRVAGVRGALSLALAVALPGMAYRGAIVAATFAVALATIASSALTVTPIVRRAVRRTQT